MDLVDKQDGLGARTQRFDDRLESLLEIPPESRAGEERSRVEREHLCVLQGFLNVGFRQTRRQTLRHRRLAHARIADEHRVVLAPTAEDFDGALQFVGPADERIEQAVACAGGQVHAVRRERIP